jgi:NADP-dependent 3-hydroxy acid dehydrogenase YdfG
MGRVKGKVALVTGAGFGQAEAEARLLAQEGAKVIATAIRFNNVRAVVDVRPTGGSLGTSARRWNPMAHSMFR